MSEKWIDPIPLFTALNAFQLDKTVKGGGNISVEVTSKDNQTVFLDTSLQQLLYGPKYPLDERDPKSNLSAVWQFTEASGQSEPGAIGPYAISNAVIGSSSIKLALTDSAGLRATMKGTAFTEIPPDYGVLVMETTKQYIFYAEQDGGRRVFALYTFDDEGKKTYLFPSPVQSVDPPPVPRSNIISAVVGNPQHVFTIKKINPIVAS